MMSLNLMHVYCNLYFVNMAILIVVSTNTSNSNPVVLVLLVHNFAFISARGSPWCLDGQWLQCQQWKGGPFELGGGGGGDMATTLTDWAL